MTEQEIRERTRLITDAYRELTDDPCGPSIPEFLQIRAAAIAELGAVHNPAGRQRTSPIRSPEKEPVKERPARVGTGRQSVPGVQTAPPATKAPGPQAAAQKIQAAPITAKASGAAPAAAPQSEFDILRGIRDQWN